MAASMNIDVFRVDGTSIGNTHWITIAPVITLTTDGGTHCDNSKLVVTYSGTRFSGSNTSYVTAASGVTKMHIYGDKKQSSIAQSNFSGSVTVSASLETSDGTIKASKTVSFSGTTDSSKFNHFAYFSASSTAEDHDFYLGTQIKVRLTSVTSLPSNDSNIKYDIYWGSGSSSEDRICKISDGVGIGEWYWTPSVEEYGNLIPSNSTYLSGTGFYAVARLDNGYELYRLPGIYPSIHLPESVVPSISSFLVEDLDGYLAEFGGYLQNYSHIKVSATYAGLYNATITSAKVTFDGTTIDIASGTPVQWADPVSISGQRPVSISVTDSRGRVATSSTNITVLPYVAPSFDSFLAQRWDATEGTETDYSTTVRLSCDGSIPAINGHAITGTIAVQGRKKGDEIWSDIGSAVSISGTFSEMFTAVDQTVDSVYNYRAFLTDRFGTMVMLEASVGTASPIMEFHASGKGIGIGTIAPEDGFSVGFPTTFKKNIKMDIPTEETGGAIFSMNWEASDGSKYGGDVVKIGGSSGTADPEMFPDLQNGDRVRMMQHLSLENSKYLLGRLTSGDDVQMLGMNSSGQVELNWTSGGLGGRALKEIWSGTLNRNGTVTIQELPYYKVFLVTVYSWGELIGIKNDYAYKAGVIDHMRLMAYQLVQDTNNFSASATACELWIDSTGVELTHKGATQRTINGSWQSSAPDAITSIRGVL